MASSAIRNDVERASVVMPDGMRERFLFGRALTSGERNLKSASDAAFERNARREAESASDAYQYRRGAFRRQSASPAPNPLEAAAGMATGAGLVSMAIPGAARVARDLKTLGVGVLGSPDTLFEVAMLGMAVKAGARGRTPGGYTQAVMSRRRAALGKLAADAVEKSAGDAVPAGPGRYRQRTGMPSEAVARDAHGSAVERQKMVDIHKSVMQTEASARQALRVPSRVSLPEGLADYYDRLQDAMRADAAAFKESVRGRPPASDDVLWKSVLEDKSPPAPEPTLWRKFGKGVKNAAKYGAPVASAVAATAYGVSAVKGKLDSQARAREVRQARKDRDTWADALGDFADSPATYAPDRTVSDALSSREAYDAYRLQVANWLSRAYAGVATPETAGTVRETLRRSVDALERRFRSVNSAAVRRYEAERQALGGTDPLTDGLRAALDRYDVETLKIGGPGNVR